MIEKFKKSLDRGGQYITLLTDSSKALDCLPHNLIIAKLHAYWFNKASLRLMHSNWQAGIRELKSIISIAFGASLNMAYLKVQLWVQYYLIYFYVLCS